MSDIKYLTDRINKFVDDRQWRKYQKPKDLAISVCLEAAELLEHFQWKTAAQVKRHIKTHKSDIADELTDVLIYLLRIAHELDIDTVKAFERKMIKNAKKYPVGKRHRKYSWMRPLNASSK